MSIGILLTLIFVCAKVFGLDPVTGWEWWKVFVPLCAELVFDVFALGAFLWFAKR